MGIPPQKRGKSKQTYQTPPAFLHAVCTKLGIAAFDVDLAADAANTAAALYFTEDDDALTMPWDVGEGWNWLNPPYGFIKPWVKRAYEHAYDHGTNTAVLVPAAVGSNWWRDWVHEKADVLLLNGRITFVGETDCFPKDCCLLLYNAGGVRTRGSYDVWTWMTDAP